MYKEVKDNYKRGNDRFIKAFHAFKVLIDSVDKLITPMELTDEVLNRQFHDTVEDYKTLEYNKKNCRLEEDVERNKGQYEVVFDFKTITSEYKHMPYLCWIYNDGIQQEFTGINKCAVDMLNALPHGKGDILLIAHNSDYGCRFILENLQNVQPIAKSDRFLQIKATYYNPVRKKKINTIVKDSYKLIPMPLRDFGNASNLMFQKKLCLILFTLMEM